MHPSLLNRAVARSTGDSLRTVRRLGFGPPIALDPDDVALVVDCPFCGKACSVPTTFCGKTPMGECDPCDIDFDFDPAEIYVTNVGTSDLMESTL